MAKQHEKVKALRSFQKWRRGKAMMPEYDPTTIGKAIDWAIAVCEQADILVNAKGRHNSEVAYRRLEAVVNETPLAEGQ